MAIIAPKAPDIEGQINTMIIDNPANITGAFQVSNHTNANSGLGGGAFGRCIINFNASNNASNCSPIYQETDTIQPPALQSIPQIRY